MYIEPISIYMYIFDQKSMLYYIYIEPGMDIEVQISRLER